MAKSKMLVYVMMAVFFAGTAFAVSPVGPSTVTRSFSSATPLQCSDLTVSLAVSVNSTDTHYTIDEYLPSGWDMIDNGTAILHLPGHLGWAVSSGANNSYTVLTYIMHVPCNATGVGTFNGTYLLNHYTSYSTIIGPSTVAVQIHPSCGNGLVEAGEQCDGGACCGSSCTFSSSSTACRAATGACDVAETCTGESASCPADGFMPAGTICSAASCASSASANLADTCNGSGACVDAGTIACSPYVCGETACKTSCATNADCSSGMACASGVCSLAPPDSDGDGLVDTIDNCPLVANPDQADVDGDGIGNACDNCVNTANPDQADADNDHIGDVCDNCAHVANADQSDVDFDGIGDACDNYNCISTGPEICNDTIDNNCDGYVDELACIYATVPTITQLTPVPVLTNDNTPDYTFTSDQAGAISYTGGCSSENTGAAVGANTITFSTLADGTHSDCAIQVTSTGGPSNVLSVPSFTVDTIAPQASITAPADGSTISGGAQQINSSVNESGSGINHVCVMFGDGGPNSFAGCSSTSPYTISWNTQNSADRAYSVYVQAVDNAGNTFLSPAIYLTINNTGDITPPVITIANPGTSPAQNKTVTASASDGTLAMSITSGEACGGSLEFAAYAPITFVNEADNGNKICYRAVDSSGNTAYMFSEAISGIDRTAPSILVVLPVSGSTYSSSPVPLSFNVSSDAVSCWYAFGGANYTLPGCNNTTLALANGNYALNVYAADAAGNTGGSSANFTVAVPGTAPPSTTNGGSSGGSGGGSSGGSSGSSSSSTDVAVNMNGTSCTVTIARAMYSTNASSVLTTTLTNIGGSECTMVNYVFADTIPSSFASIPEIAFSPPYTSVSGSTVTFGFPSFASGESKTLTYTVARWVSPRRANDFTAYSMSGQKIAAPVPTPNIAPVAQETPSPVPAPPVAKPAAKASPPEAPILAGAAQPQANENLLAGALFDSKGSFSTGGIILVFIAGMTVVALSTIMLLFGKKCKACSTRNKAFAKDCSKCASSLNAPSRGQN